MLPDKGCSHPSGTTRNIKCKSPQHNQKSPLNSRPKEFQRLADNPKGPGSSSWDWRSGCHHRGLPRCQEVHREGDDPPLPTGACGHLGQHGDPMANMGTLKQEAKR